MERPLQLVIRCDSNGHVQTIQASGDSDVVDQMVCALLARLELAAEAAMPDAARSHMIAQCVVTISALLDALSRNDKRLAQHSRALGWRASRIYEFMARLQHLQSEASQAPEQPDDTVGGEYGHLYFTYEWLKQVGPGFPRFALPDTRSG